MILLALCISLVALAPFSVDSRYCGSAHGMENLDMDQVEGVWWEWESGSLAGFLRNHWCFAMKLYPQEDGKTIKTVNKYEYMGTGDRNGRRYYQPKHVTMRWTISNEGSTKNGEFVLMRNRISKVKEPFLILETDYKTYLLAFICKETEYRYLMIFTRFRDLTVGEIEELDRKVDSALGRNGLTRQELMPYHASQTVDCKRPQFPDATT